MFEGTTIECTLYEQIVIKTILSSILFKKAHIVKKIIIIINLGLSIQTNFHSQQLNSGPELDVFQGYQ